MGTTIPERVSQIYYTYGLFCSSYPVTAITVAITIVLLCCYPLLNVPLPGNIPTVVTIPLNIAGTIDDAQYKSKIQGCSTGTCQTEEPFSLNQILFNETQKLPYIWVKNKPLLYVHQIILKTGVSPWNSNLRMLDAFRTPIQEVFRLLETIRNHEDPETKTTLVRHCHHIDNIKRRDSKASKERVLPEYSCLLLSPANLWQQNLQKFSQDSNIVTTILNYQNLQKGKASIAEMAFGLYLRDAGIKRYPLRSRPRVVQYAITIFYSQAEVRFINSLSKKLQEMYPLYQDQPQAMAQEAKLIYYPGEFNYRDIVPLTIIFFGVFLYVYYSVRKIEFIKSKLGLAACAVLTIAGSLSMCMGICFSFGFSLSLQSKEIFPYLVIIVGLENVLVLTKSVISTDSRLDVKIRLAQGLSKEGWSITTNLLIEITIFTVSLFTFVPFIQEFSIFMIICHISDYFMQMAFFATILGIDVRRMEYLQEQNNKLHLKEYFDSNSALNWRTNKLYEDNSPHRMTKSKSHPRLNGLAHTNPTDVIANRKNGPIHMDNKVPKRIRLVQIWARTRPFQRAFMIWMIVWISNILYNSGIVEYLVYNADKNEPSFDANRNYSDNKVFKLSDIPLYKNNAVGNDTREFSSLVDMTQTEKTSIHENETITLKHYPHYRPWTKLSPYFWSTILSQYNESFTGEYIVVLPPLLLSCRLSPELAINARNPEEKDPPKLRWQALAAALDPIDIMPDFELMEMKGQSHLWGKTLPATDLPIYPTTPMEILLLAILCTISVLVIVYMMVVLYRCVCSRNYAEWRASWNENEDYLKIIAKQPALQLVMEAVPLVVVGHQHEVECLVSDGEKVVSSCLQGTIKVWDPQNGDLLTEIDRYEYFNTKKWTDPITTTKGININNEAECNRDLLSAKCACHSTSHENLNEVSHTLRKRLVDHVSHLSSKLSSSTDETDQPRPRCTSEKTKYDFAKTFRDLYSSQQSGEHHNSHSHEYNEYTESNHSNRNHDKNGAGFKLDNINFNDFKVARINRDRNNSLGDSVVCHADQNCDNNATLTNFNWKNCNVKESPVWCMDYCSDLIILGCADGRLEFWEASTAKLLCLWWHGGDRSGCAGVTQIRALSSARRFCAATLGGQLILVRLDAYNASAGVRVDWRFSTAHKRTHKRTGSAGSIGSYYVNRDDNAQNHDRLYNGEDQITYDEEVHCVRLAQCRAHQQPITEMHSQGNRILTGGQDHILKVFLNTDLTPLFTLHGHCGPITSCFIDHANPTIGGSGSQDGLLCVWDLLTGACLYSTQAHDGAVTSLAYTASYVVSCGADERLCIWDRFQGHMLNSIHVGLNYMSRMLPLTHSMLLMGDRSGLTVYDLSSGEIIRRVILGQNDGCIFVRQILPLKDAVVCDYANQLRIVRFPLVSKLSYLKNE